MLCGSLGGRGVWGRMDTCICMGETLHCSCETTTTLLIGYTPTQNKVLKKKIASPQTFLELPVISRVLQSLSLKGAQQNILR